MASSSSSAEAELNKLRRIKENKTCITCDIYARFGHNYVCEKFHLFVCNNCKSALQAYSFRVKSINMSNWTSKEVDEIKESNNGGNAAGRRLWLAKWTPQQYQKPNETDDIIFYKQFIHTVFIEQRFKKNDKEVDSTQVTRPKKQIAESEGVPSTINLLDGNLPLKDNTESVVFSEFSTFEHSPPAPAKVSEEFDFFNANASTASIGNGRTFAVTETAKTSNITETTIETTQAAPTIETTEFGDFATAVPSFSSSCPSNGMASNSGDLFANVDFTSAAVPNSLKSNIGVSKSSSFPYGVGTGGSGGPSTTMNAIGNITDLLSPEALEIGPAANPPPRTINPMNSMPISNSNAHAQTRDVVSQKSQSLNMTSSCNPTMKNDAFADLLKGQI